MKVKGIHKHLVILIKEERNICIFVFCKTWKIYMICWEATVYVFIFFFFFNKSNPVNKSKQFGEINLDSRVEDMNKSCKESSEECASDLKDTRGSMAHIWNRLRDPWKPLTAESLKACLTITGCLYVPHWVMVRLEFSRRGSDWNIHLYVFSFNDNRLSRIQQKREWLGHRLTENNAQFMSPEWTLWIS